MTFCDRCGRPNIGKTKSHLKYYSVETGSPNYWFENKSYCTSTWCNTKKWIPAICGFWFLLALFIALPIWVETHSVAVTVITTLILPIIAIMLRWLYCIFFLASPDSAPVNKSIVHSTMRNNLNSKKGGNLKLGKWFTVSLVATSVFFFCRLFGYLDWLWFWVFAPVIFVAASYALVPLLGFMGLLAIIAKWRRK